MVSVGSGVATDRALDSHGGGKHQVVVRRYVLDHIDPHIAAKEDGDPSESEESDLHAEQKGTAGINVGT